MNNPFLPGFTQTSGLFNVVFMKANPHTFGFNPYPLMDIILELAGIEDGDFETIRSGLEEYLNEDVSGTAEHATATISDEPFFPRTMGHMKKIKISLKGGQYPIFNQYNMIVEFSLTKRNAVQTLQDLAMNTIFSNVTNHRMINKMEIPETLKMTLRKEFYNEWSRRRFPSYNITLLPFAESLNARGIDVKTLDLIMDEYMYRIELTRKQLATGFLDKKAKKVFIWNVWRPFVQKIDRLGSPAPLHHLKQTINEFVKSPKLVRVRVRVG